jgi:hypothetical protein
LIKTGATSFDYVGLILLDCARPHSAVATHFPPYQISLSDAQLIDLPGSQKASDIAVFAGKVPLPCDADRIPAAQYGLALFWPMQINHLQCARSGM